MENKQYASKYCACMNKVGKNKDVKQVEIKMNGTIYGIEHLIDVTEK